MRKLLILLAAGLAALTFAGCGNGQATSQEAVDGLANPWEDMKSLSEAEEAAGFTVELPSAINTGKETVCRYCQALNAVEVQFADPAGYLRKAKDSGDISGDYNEYAEEKEADVSGVKVTLKGAAADQYNLAVWTDGEYAYCIGLDEAVNGDTMTKMAAELK